MSGNNKRQNKHCLSPTADEGLECGRWLRGLRRVFLACSYLIGAISKPRPNENLSDENIKKK